MEPYILTAVAILVCHYLYEAILRPTLLIVLRSRLLILRSHLLQDLATQDSNFPEYKILLERIQYSLNRIDSIYIWTYWGPRSPHDLTGRNDSTGNNIKALSGINQIEKQFTQYLAFVMVINAGMLLLYLLPLTLTAIGIFMLFNKGRRFLRGVGTFRDEKENRHVDTLPSDPLILRRI